MSEQDRLPAGDPPGGSNHERAGDGHSQIVPLTTRRRITQVPSPPATTLVGRDAELDLVIDLLRRGGTRLVTLTGPGGVGKTRLALEIISRRNADEMDGVAWVPLASVQEPDRVVAAIASALSVGETSERPLHHLVTSTLRNQQLLLVLDNFEHVLDAAPQLSAILQACPGIRALVTSRSPLRISGERVLPVRPLAVPAILDLPSPDRLGRIEAVQLFMDRATSVSPSFGLTSVTGPQILDICRRLDGLPLAIELAAARIYHLPVQTLHARLDNRLPLLTDGPRDAPSRHQTLRNTIAWSHDLLPPAERSLFRHLAVFVGGFTLEAAEAIGNDTGTILNRLTALVDKSLVHYQPEARGGPRYGLLETVREFASEHLAASGEMAIVRERHASFYVRLAQERRSGQAWGLAQAWADELEADHDNLRAALDWLAESGRWLDYLELATALSRFWDVQGCLSEARARLERVLVPAPPAGASPALVARASAALGLTGLRQGDLELAELHLEAAHAIWLRLEDVANLAHITVMLGGVAEYGGDDDRAQPLYERALSLFERVDDPSGIALTLNNLADLAYRRGAIAQAEILGQRALEVSRQAALPMLISESLITVGAAASARGDLPRASAAFREALQICQEAGFQLVLGAAVVGLADVATAAGEPRRAARLLGVADTIAGQLEVPRFEHDALHRHAIAATRHKLDDEAFEHARSEGREMSLEEALDEARTVSVGASPGAASPLTRREREVLQLLVAGKTDRAIAEELFIGTRTVESHVAHIFEKLGVHSRAAAAAAAVAAGYVDPPNPPVDSTPDP